MMKYKISKAEFDSLNEELKNEYTLNGEEAQLKIEEGPDVTKLETKLSLEKEHRKRAEDARDAAEDREAQLKKDFKKAGGDADKIKDLEEKHTQELERIRQERENEKAEVLRQADQALIRETAQKFASEHFTIPALMVDQFSKRLNVEEVGGSRVVRVLDADGNASVLGLSDLQKEFLDNKEFSTIIKAKVGAGGGASPLAGGGADHTKGKALTITEKVALKKADPEKFAALFPNG